VALKALSHPLRVRLLATLRESGPATATELATLLDTDSASTSYHLRVLAQHGFV
jgi:DNA-binding transcriptional ArsR family regulator